MTSDDKRKLFLAAAGAGALLGAAALLKRPGYSFQGKVALITGGSRGLGLVLARELASEGAAIAICARDEDELGRAERDVAALGANVLSVACDVTNPAEAERCVRTVESHFGRIDILVNNAGIIAVGPLETMTLDDFERAMNTHFWGPLHTVRAALPGMRRQGGGRIANISSIGGKLSVPHLLPYSASKFALVGLSRGLRAELELDNIVVTTICPGLMRTGSPRHAEFKGRQQAEYAWFAVAGSLPVSSISAGSAARQIVKAIRSGAAEVVLSPQAKLATMLDALFPEWTAAATALAVRFLPDAGEASGSRKGYESESGVTRSVLTRLTQKAAERNNEM